jgi:hypothetical protein
MNKQTIDELLSAMISGGEGISDLLFTVGKPPFIESHGSLSEFSMKTSTPVCAQRSGQISRQYFQAERPAGHRDATIAIGDSNT